MSCARGKISLIKVWQKALTVTSIKFEKLYVRTCTYVLVRTYLYVRTCTYVLVRTYLYVRTSTYVLVLYYIIYVLKPVIYVNHNSYCRHWPIYIPITHHRLSMTSLNLGHVRSKIRINERRKGKVLPPCQITQNCKLSAVFSL